MNGRELGQALRDGRRVYGTLIVSTSPRWCDAVRDLGLDLVFLDTEHIAIDRATLSWMCQAYRAMDVAPLVRIPSPDPYQACMVLDGGACGVVVPYVESAEQVRAIRGAVKLRPLKGRRLTDALSGSARLEPELADYLEARSAGSVLVINIESVPAMQALDEILAVPGIDAVLIGPHDLSVSLGIPEQYTHPRFDEAVRTILRKAREKDIGAGIHFSTGIEQEIAWARAGANLIMHGGDITLFRDAFRADRERFRSALGETAGEGEREDLVV